MFCTNCGSIIEDSSDFCTDCGNKNSIKKDNNDKKINFFRWVGYVWTIIVNLITLGVMLGIYSSLYASFEKIVVSLLILIYLSIQAFAVTYGNATIETAFSNYSEFERIRKLLRKSEVGSEEEEFEKEEVLGVRKKIEKAKVKMYINMGFAFIFYIIALINLIGAITE